MASLEEIAEFFAVAVNYGEFANYRKLTFAALEIPVCFGYNLNNG